MSRPLRLEFPGALYHVTARGNARQRIYRDTRDFDGFLEVLDQVVDRFGWLLHAYCLIPNHYHLLVETPVPNLSRGMRQLNGVYAQRFNRCHGRVGHVFQARYGALLVEKERHLLALARYVALNPVRAGLAPRPERWRWSSYRATAGLERPPRFLTVAWLQQLFAADGSGGRAFARYVIDGVECDGRPAPLGEIYVGDEAFAEAHAPFRPLEEIPRPQWQPLRPSLHEVFRTHSSRAIPIAYRRYGYTLRDIASHLGVHYATVSRRLRALEGDLDDRQVRECKT